MSRREALISIMVDALENTKGRNPNCRGPFVIRFPEDIKIQTLEEVEMAHIRDVIGLLGGNMREAAKRLGISRSTLYLKIEKYGIASQPQPTEAQEEFADRLNETLWPSHPTPTA